MKPYSSNVFSICMSREHLANCNQRFDGGKITFLPPAFFTSIADFTRLIFFHPLSKNKKNQCCFVRLALDQLRVLEKMLV